jgi:hypothetical protein
MRFQRNAGARGAAEWMCLTPTQSECFCYARVVLAKDVTFEIAGRDGWALGDLKWLAGAEPASLGKLLRPEIAACINPRALARLPVHGWEPLWFRAGHGFFSGARKLDRVRWLLLGPGLAVVRPVA